MVVTSLSSQRSFACGIDHSNGVAVGGPEAALTYSRISVTATTTNVENYSAAAEAVRFFSNVLLSDGVTIDVRDITVLSTQTAVGVQYAANITVTGKNTLARHARLLATSTHSAATAIDYANAVRVTGGSTLIHEDIIVNGAWLAYGGRVFDAIVDGGASLRFVAVEVAVSGVRSLSSFSGDASGVYYRQTIVNGALTSLSHNTIDARHNATDGGSAAGVYMTTGFTISGGAEVSHGSVSATSLHQSAYGVFYSDAIRVASAASVKHVSVNATGLVSAVAVSFRRDVDFNNAVLTFREISASARAPEALNAFAFDFACGVYMLQDVVIGNGTTIEITDVVVSGNNRDANGVRFSTDVVVTSRDTKITHSNIVSRTNGSSAAVACVAYGVRYDSNVTITEASSVTHTNVSVTAPVAAYGILFNNSITVSGAGVSVTSNGVNALTAFTSYGVRYESNVTIAARASVVHRNVLANMTTPAGTPKSNEKAFAYGVSFINVINITSASVEHIGVTAFGCSDVIEPYPFGVFYGVFCLVLSVCTTTAASPSPIRLFPTRTLPLGTAAFRRWAPLRSTQPLYITTH